MAKLLQVVAAGARWRLAWDDKGFEVSRRQYVDKWDEMLAGSGKLDLQWLLERAEVAAKGGTTFAIPTEVIEAFIEAIKGE